MTAGTSAEALVGTLFLNGGGLAVLFVIFIAIFLAAEFESGFSKNVFTVQPNRLAFLATRTVEVVVLAAAFVVVTVAATLATAFAAGFEAPPSSRGTWRFGARSSRSRWPASACSPRL